MSRFPLFKKITLLLAIGIGISLGAPLLAQVPAFSGPKEDSAKKKIRIRHADVLKGIEENGVRYQKLWGNVWVQHDSTFIYCDSLYLYEAENRIKAFSRVKVEMPDSVTMLANRMDYDGNKRVADAYDNITLTDGDARLETDLLSYFRNDDYGEFRDGGVLYDGQDTLTSNYGSYFPSEDIAYFKEDVVLVNPDRRLETDTLGYDTKNRIAYFLTETRIISEDGELTTYEGNYDTENKEINLFSRNKVVNEDYDLESDSLYFDNQTDIGYARGNVVASQRDSSMTVQGNYGVFNRKTDESYVTENAVAIQYFDDDTLYIAADTLFTLKSYDTIRIPIPVQIYEDSLSEGGDTLSTVSLSIDSTGKEVMVLDTTVAWRDSVVEKRIFRAYHNVRFFMNDMQGKCDSMVYFYSDSIIELYADPIMWADSSQISGDTIYIFMKDNNVDSMSIVKNGFMVSQEDSVGFNQIKGKNMRAKFRDNKLHYLHVIGNSETIYFAKDDETQEYQGINQSSSQQMYIFFEDNEVVKIKNIKEMQAELIPFFMIMFQKNELSGMRWRITERPEKPVSPDEFADSPVAVTTEENPRQN